MFFLCSLFGQTTRPTPLRGADVCMGGTTLCAKTPQPLMRMQSSLRILTGPNDGTEACRTQVGWFGRCGAVVMVAWLQRLLGRVHLRFAIPALPAIAESPVLALALAAERPPTLDIIDAGAAVAEPAAPPTPKRVPRRALS